MIEALFGIVLSVVWFVCATVLHITSGLVKLAAIPFFVVMLVCCAFVRNPEGASS